MTFRGVFDHTLDSKNRLMLPKPYRDAFRDGLVLAIPADRRPCIWIARPADYERYTASALAELSPLSARRLALERFFFSMSRDDLTPDVRERIMLPAPMLERAGIPRDATQGARAVVIVGAGTRLECWDARTWSHHQSALFDEVDAMTSPAG
jgi:MraZ protein